MKCPKTVTNADEYLAWVSEGRRADLTTLHQAIQKAAPSLESAIVYGMLGYGPHQHETKSGSEGDWFIVGLAEQKNHLALYLCACDEDGYLAERYSQELGKVNCGKSCIRFKKLADLNLPFAMELVAKSVEMHAQTK